MMTAHHRLLIAVPVLKHHRLDVSLLLGFVFVLSEAIHRNVVERVHTLSLDSRSRPAASRVSDAFNSYSVRSASIGFTRVARRAGTKQEIAATKVRRPATTR